MYNNELEHVYDQAYKLGKSAWYQMISKGEVGYLPSLDGVVQTEDIASESYLGLVEIPLNKIQGTYTHSRSISFAHNFMPIMDKKTEFSAKWRHVYNYHIEEGITDPIKVYEYLNRFFVVEGNKRVSVLKFVGATSINGYVTRLIPKRDRSNKVNCIYYEFMDFYKITGINTIWFSNEGSFSELLDYMNRYTIKESQQFDDNKYKVFIANIYRPFREIYLQLGGSKLEITTGDALLTFLKIYGVPDEITSDNNKDSIKKLIDELRVIDPDETNVKTDELLDPQKKRGVFSSLTSMVNLTPKKPLKIAFIYAKDPKTSGWAYAHELGRLHIDNIFKDQIITEKIANVPENEEAYFSLEKLAEAGNDIIFTTSPTFLAPSLKAAMQYPETKFFNCGTTHSYKSLTLYFGRIYEARYLLGMIAGAVTKSNIIGYVAPYPISEVISSINAFTLGAQAVNPYVKIKAMWTNRWDNPEGGKHVAQSLKEAGADIISNEDLPIPGDNLKEYGVYSISESPNLRLHYAMAIWDWGVFYEKVIKNILSDTWKMIYDEKGSSQLPMNFWLGMNTGIVDILHSNRNINEPMKRLIQSVKNSIIANEFNIFEGPLYDQNKKLVVKHGEILTYDDIINMDWLVNGVEGSLPDLNEIKPTDPLSYMRSIIKK